MKSRKNKKSNFHRLICLLKLLIIMNHLKISAWFMINREWGKTKKKEKKKIQFNFLCSTFLRLFDASSFGSTFSRWQQEETWIDSDRHNVESYLSVSIQGNNSKIDWLIKKLQCASVIELDVLSQIRSIVIQLIVHLFFFSAHLHHHSSIFYLFANSNILSS